MPLAYAAILADGDGGPEEKRRTNRIKKRAKRAMIVSEGGGQKSKSRPKPGPRRWLSAFVPGRIQPRGGPRPG